MRCGDQPEPPAVDHDPAAVRVKPLDLDVGLVHVRACGDPDPESPRAKPGDAHAVAGAAEFQVERTAGVVLHLGTPAMRRGQQPLRADLLLVLVGLDRGGGQRDGGVLMSGEAAFCPDSVYPAGVRVASITSGWPSRSSTKLLLAAPPSMTTVVSASARRSRPRASERSRP